MYYYAYMSYNGYTIDQGFMSLISMNTESLYQDWDAYDVLEQADAFIYLNDGTYYACYNGYSYYLMNGGWYFDWWNWGCQESYDSYVPLSGYLYYYAYMSYNGYTIDQGFMTLYSWDASDVIYDGGFIYYQNDYLYACYNGFQYYFADGTWYWNMLAWNCEQSTWPDAGYD